MPAVLTVPIGKQNLRSCVKCGRCGHMETTCEFPDRAINMIGCEIEGYWYDHNQLASRCRTFGASWTGDGSLGTRAECALAIQWRHFNDGRQGVLQPTADHDAYGCEICKAASMEVRTHPGSLAHMCNQIAGLFPDVVSGKASLHVHVSFLDAMSISYLACKAFHEHFRTSITEFCNARKLPAEHWLRKRIRGEACDPDARPRGQSARGGFCQIERHPGEFPATMIINGAIPLQDQRYEMINYHAYANHGTIEFRVGSAFQDPADAIAYVTHLHDMIESWIAVKGAEAIAAQIGHVEYTPDAGKATIEIGALPDAPAMISNVIEIGAADLEVPKVREGAILSTVQTVNRHVEQASSKAIDRHIVQDSWSGMNRLRQSPTHDPSGRNRR